MKKIKLILAAVTVVSFTACYNPNSSTSAEPREETSVKHSEHEVHEEKHDMEHAEKMEHSMNADSTHKDADHMDSTKKHQ